MNDFNLLGGFGDRQTNERTFALLESLSRLKKKRMPQKNDTVVVLKRFSHFPVEDLIVFLCLLVLGNPSHLSQC